MVSNWSRMIQMTIGSTDERVEQDQADLGVEQRQRLVEDEERQREDDRGQDELGQEEERDVGVLHVGEPVLEAAEAVGGERAEDDRQQRGADRDDRPS